MDGPTLGPFVLDGSVRRSHDVVDSEKQVKRLEAGREVDGCSLEAAELPDIEIADDGEMTASDGVVTGRSDDREAFVDAIAEHRHRERSPKEVLA